MLHHDLAIRQHHEMGTPLMIQHDLQTHNQRLLFGLVAGLGWHSCHMPAHDLSFDGSQHNSNASVSVPESWCPIHVHQQRGHRPATMMLVPRHATTTSTTPNAKQPRAI